MNILYVREAFKKKSKLRDFVPISIRRVGGKIKSKMSLIKMSLFMVERKGSNEKGTKSLSLLFFRGHSLVSLN